MKRFGGERIKSMMDFVGMEDDSPMENKLLTKAVENAQSKVEGFNFEIRKLSNLLSLLSLLISTILTDIVQIYRIYI